jgi:hypothetical protein
LGWLCPPKPAFLKYTTTQAIREMTFAKQVIEIFKMITYKFLGISRHCFAFKPT